MSKSCMLIIFLGLILCQIASAFPPEPANPTVLKVTLSQTELTAPKNLFQLNLQDLDQVPPVKAWVLPLKGTFDMHAAEKMLAMLELHHYPAYLKPLGRQYQVMIGPTLSQDTLKEWQSSLSRLALSTNKPLIYAFDS